MKLVLVLISIVLLSFSVYAEGTKAPAQTAPQAKAKVATTCPVMGGEINKEIFTDYKGKRIYFCCKGCPSEFNKDPEKYVKKMEAKGFVFEKTPKAK